MQQLFVPPKQRRAASIVHDARAFVVQLNQVHDVANCGKRVFDCLATRTLQPRPMGLTRSLPRDADSVGCANRANDGFCSHTSSVAFRSARILGATSLGSRRNDTVRWPLVLAAFKRVRPNIERGL
jgi:hypothetical protein